MNTNLLHNIMNILIAVVAALSTPEVVAILPPELAVKVVGGLSVLKLGINVVRDGVSGLTKVQPPVRDK